MTDERDDTNGRLKEIDFIRINLGVSLQCLNKTAQAIVTDIGRDDVKKAVMRYEIPI